MELLILIGIVGAVLFWLFGGGSNSGPGGNRGRRGGRGWKCRCRR